MAQRAFDIVVNVDTKSADRQLNKFEKELKGTQAQLQKLGSGISTTGLDKFSSSANDATNEVKKLSSTPVEVDTSQATRALSNFENDIRDTQSEMQKLGGSVSTSNLNRFGKAANDATTEVKQLDSATGALDSNLGQIGSSFGGLSGEVGGLAGSMVDLGQTFALTTGGMTAEQTTLQAALANNSSHIQNYQRSINALDRDSEDYQSTLRSMTDDLEDMQQHQAEMTEEFNRQSSVLGRAASMLRTNKVAIVAVGAAAILSAGQLSKLTMQMATLAQTDVRTFQQFAFATSQFGINTEQAANILKDFNDRIGDFVITGGGPFIDVIERLGKETGLTAEKIAGLSGPEGLIFLVNSMEQANLSMQEQTFLLESVGSDLTALLPLLKNNGKAYKELAASIASVQASEPALASLNTTANTFGVTLETLKGLFLELSSVLAPALTLALEGINFILGGLVIAVKTFNIAVTFAAAGLATLFGDTEGADELFRQFDQMTDSLLNSSAATDKLKENVAALQRLQEKTIATENTNLQKQIDNQVKLASAIGISVSEYEKQKKIIANVAAQEKLRADLQKKNLTKDQIDKLVNELIRLQTVTDTVTAAVQIQTDAEAKATEQTEALKQSKLDLAQAERDRLESISDYITGLEDELMMTRARTEAERDAIRARQELRKFDLTPEQLAHIENLQRQIALQKDVNDAVEKSIAINIKSIGNEVKRAEAVDKFSQSLQNQLAVLQTKTDLEKEQLLFEQQLAGLDLKGNEQAQLQTIQNQIVAQKELNRVLEEQKDAYQELGSAVTEWALGSEDAIISVIAQMVRLIALSSGFDQNPFVQGFLGGLQGFANGGTFGAGETFMVGEKGPEIITSEAAGRVIPNHQLGGSSGSFSQNISLSINGSIVASEELDRKFEEFAGAVADSTSSMLRNQMRTGGVLA